MGRRALLLASLAVLAALLLFAAWVWLGLPPRAEVRALARANPARTRLMEQRAEEAKARGRRTRASHSWVPLSRVSRHLIHAVIASEDQAFFGHEGVDWRAIEESIERNVERRRFARGGSTITQQLAKNLYFGTRKSVLRKARELVVTQWLEHDLSKARILALYLNLIEWGDGVYGCEAGSRAWYGKPASELSVEEAAGLAAMIPNPRRLNPRASAARHQRATRRVLWLMGLAGYLGRDAAGLGAEPPPEPVPPEEDEPPPEDPGAAPDVGAPPTPQEGEATPAPPDAVPEPPAASPLPPAEPAAPPEPTPEPLPDPPQPDPPPPARAREVAGRGTGVARTPAGGTGVPFRAWTSQRSWFPTT
jgi:monofunctional biosynthetic peptidoglycan transglycosylase